MNITSILHAIRAVAVQGLVECIAGDWVYGAATVCTFFVARGYTQAEHHWIKRFGGGYRHKMPWRGGFDPHAWDMTSLVDFVAPAVAYTELYDCMLILS